MKIFAPYSIPLFLSGKLAASTIAAQVATFDVYYDVPPVVGFNVVGSSSSAEVSGFYITGPASCVHPQVIGFSVTTSTASPEVSGFIVTSDGEEES
jgi:hypothetical protein